MLIKRRDKIGRRAICTPINPLINFALDGTAADVRERRGRGGCGGATAGGYRRDWASFDNATGATQPVGDTSAAVTTLAPPPGLGVTAGGFVQVAITAIDQRYPSWAAPVTVHFKREPQGWKLVGVERLP